MKSNNAPPMERPDWRKLCLHQVFEAQAARIPGSPALSMDGQTLTYRELNERANRIAHLLVALGAGPEKTVALYLNRSSGLIAGMLGILKSGAAYVPIDPSCPAGRIAHIVHDSGARLVLTESSLAQNITSLPVNLICVDADHDEIVKRPATDPTTGVRPGNLVYIIYTSGSTGKPKGVMVEHRNIVRLFENVQPYFSFSGEDVWTHFHSCAFGFSVWEIWGALLFGGRLVIVPNRIAASPDDFYKLLSCEHVTVLSQTPSFFRQLAHKLEHLADDRKLHLRYIFFSGEPLDLQSLRPWFERNGGEHPQLINMYAITETSGEVAYRRIGKNDLTPGVRSIIGKPFANIEVHILDEHLQTVAEGEPGEIFIGGETLARGYRNNPELTAQNFIPNPFKPGSGELLYRTGDRACRLPEGDIEFLGRIDNQVKIYGYRIELGEIEAALTEDEGIDEAVAVLGKDASGEPRLVAYYVPAAQGWARIRRETEAHASSETGTAMELWPSLGQYHLYDELLYFIMSTEEKTNMAYREALGNSVKGKVVVDIGTGGEAIFARLAAEAGARKVYAIELLADAAERARALVRNLGLAEKIEVMQGDAITVDLPEKADVAVERIFGNIGSADGVVRVMNDARRYLKENAVCIPGRCVTRIAAASLPASFRAHPGFTKVSAKYVQQVFDHLGHELDLRLCVRNFPASNLISDRAIFEDLDFTGVIEPEYQRRSTLTLSANGLLDGFLLWAELETPGGGQVSYLENQNAWLPVYFPVFDPALEVRTGDKIEIEMICSMSANGINPEYRIKGRVVHADGNSHEFDHESFYDKKNFRASPFYRRIFRAAARRSEKPAATSLREHLKKFLPDYMIPPVFMELDSLPLNANGKLDRAALPTPGRSRPELGQEFVEPQTGLERVLGKMWMETLGIERVGVHDNFFDLGGHSINAVYLSNKIQSMLGEYFHLIAIFDAPTIAGQIEYLERHYPHAVARLTHSRATEQFGYERAPSRSGSDDELAKLLEEIESLPDDEKQKILAQGESPAPLAAR